MTHKRNSNRILAATAMLLSLALFFACDRGMTGPEAAGSTALSLDAVGATVATCGADTEVPLLAGRDIAAGTVTVRNDQVNLYVTYATTGDWMLHATHLAVGDSKDDIPTNNGGNPQIGHFPYDAVHDPSVSSYTYTIPLAELGLEAGEDAYVAAHADLDREGAWGKGTQIKDGNGSWAMYFTHEVQRCAPTAVISAPTNGSADVPVVFDGSGSTDPQNGGLTFRWDFGDGKLGGSEQIAHLYSDGGSHTVTLTVTNEFGLSDAATHTITISDPPAPTGTATLFGEVTDAEGNPLQGVTTALVGGSLSGETDSKGKVTIANFPVGASATLEVSKSGYLSQIVRLDPAGSLTEVRFTTGLRQASRARAMDADAGGTVASEDGASVTLQAGALVDASGNPVSGEVQVSLTPIDVSGGEIEAFPGDFAGVTTGGQEGILLSYGAMDITITQGGKELQLAPGQTAVIEIPIYTSGASVGDEIPLWSLDEETGIWIQEGAGVVVSSTSSPTGLALRATITHLSWWNCDIFPGDGGKRDVRTMCVGVDAQGDTHAGCVVVTETTSPGPQYRASTTLPAAGASLVYPLNYTFHVEARAFGAGCVLVGETDVADLASAIEIVVTVACSGEDDVTRISYSSIPVKGEISTGDQEDVYVFAGEAGDVVAVDIGRSAGSGLSGTFFITDPGNELLVSRTFSDDPGLAVLTLEQSGDYRIFVAGQTETVTGGYGVLVELLEAPSIHVLTAGRKFTCSIIGTGDGYCWGDNFDGSLGDGTRGDSPVPTAISGGFSFRSIDAGPGGTACGITTAGQAYCWGSNSTGQLGHGEESFSGRSSQPVRVVGGLTFVSISVGSEHVCGITTGGDAYCWGRNLSGQLGIGHTLFSTNEPVAVVGGLTFASITAGNDFTCGVTTDGVGYCWGDNLDGELGIGIANGEFSEPVEVAGDLTFRIIEAGGGSQGHTCGLTTSGVAYCWGSQASGRLGNGIADGSSSTVPVPVLGGFTFTSLSAGFGHNCAISAATATVYCWGDLRPTDLGAVNNVPVEIPGGLTFTSITAGVRHTCGIATDGVGYCWGSNVSGQLGDGTVIFSRSEPTPILLNMLAEGA